MMSAEQTHVMGSGIIGNSLANIFNRNLSYTTNFSLIKIEGKLIYCDVILSHRIGR